MILMYFPFLSVWQMIRPWLNGIGFITLSSCYIFTTLEVRKVCEGLGYLNTMRRLWARQREPRV
jgi:hypothetical protein